MGIDSIAALNVNEGDVNIDLDIIPVGGVETITCDGTTNPYTPSSLGDIKIFINYIRSKIFRL